MAHLSQFYNDDVFAFVKRLILVGIRRVSVDLAQSRSREQSLFSIKSLRIYYVLKIIVSLYPRF